MDEMKTARSLIKRFQTNNPSEICKCLEFIVLTVPLTGIRGFFQYYKKIGIIYISEDLNEHEHRFVCAHELGHAVMHRNSNAIFMDTRTFLRTSTYEREANRFAIDLNYSDDDLQDYLQYSTPQIAECLNLLLPLVEYRLGVMKKQLKFPV